MRKSRIRRFVPFLRRHPNARWAMPVAGLLVIALLPVPWLKASTPNPPGMAWRLDGRFQFDGETIDPQGTWYALSAGRPPLVGEVVLSWINPDIRSPRNMTRGSGFNSPAMAEPAAIAIGLVRAGREIKLTTVVEVSGPTIPGLPERVQVALVNGQAITTGDEWSNALSNLGQENEFIARGGAVHYFSGAELPYLEVATMGLPIEASVSLTGWLRFVPESWYRNLTLGRSHGLILALAAYTHASGEDLARGRVIAGTGAIRIDGTISAVGGLAAKAQAAHRAGVDVFVYPAAQRCQGDAVAESLRDQDMTMQPVETLDEAIGVLRGAPGPPPETGCP
ncbi:MAG TPA: S16 family serine protease [Acidimicrobiia bacterium]|nr:S16 family serine protease [Acidimicrobiia bacterium]